MKKAILAIVSDLHANSTLGLHPLKFTLDGGDIVSASPAQKWLWGKWIMFWGTVEELKKKHKCPVIVVVNGEAADDLTHKSSERHSLNKADIIYLAGAVLQPALEVAEKIYVTRGTEAHVGTSGELDELVAHDIGATMCGNRHSWFHLPLNVCGTRFDIAHHPGVSSRRPWTRMGPSQVLATTAMYEHYNESTAFRPHFIIRSHVHTYSDSYENYPVRAIITPPWQLNTSFARRLGYNKVEPPGGVIAICEEGHKAEIIVKRYEPKGQRYVVEEIA